MINDWRASIVKPGTAILEAIRILDETPAKICLVVDDSDRLIATVTDGDIRRGLLRSVQLGDTVEKIMKSNPVTSSESEDHLDRIRAMASRRIHQMPIVNDFGQVVGLETLSPVTDKDGEHDNWVVLMAGGLGTRLHPLTHTTPKPLIEVGGKPILETIIEQFTRQGFRRIHISVNYRRDMIKSYFGDGSRWNADIKYLNESEALGTAGALGLLAEKPHDPMIVMNADLLTKVNFEALLDIHRQTGADATMAVREYDFQVPFGVVDLEGDQITDIIEKPVHKFFVNAGLYVVEPEVLDHIPVQAHLDMPELFRNLIGLGKRTTVFPIREYWLDIGRADDLHRARQEFGSEFSTD
ncbi:putative Nucleotidyl transferase [Magnetospira sp. QH-2]|nr:nucleotidyltransferase family protein [Magnetospira sp. QH-2]CCQ75520.1 putative Nucleotidyl transferase [Magnetospira sp. QH-2]